LKALVVGYGSVGKRHIQNLSELPGMTITVFTHRKNDSFLKQKKCIIFRNLQDCVSKTYDFAIIANESNLHIETALVLARKNIPFILEKPLSHKMKNVKKLISLIKKNNLITLMGCNLRFHPCIRKIKYLLDNKKIGKILSVKVENGSYLPNWHPDENYQKSYASRQELGGGVVLTSIHEIDYLYWFFGNVKEVISMTGKFSSLKINTADLSSSLLFFKNNFVSELHLDYFQHFPFRSCKIIGSKGIIYWDTEINSVKIFNVITKRWKKEFSLQNYNFNSTYKDEIKYFLECLKNDTQTINSVEDGAKVLEIGLAILKSSKLKKMVQI
jgi:predicted dehydrogenase